MASAAHRLPFREYEGPSLSNAKEIRRKDRMIHCENGPAVIFKNGTKMWFWRNRLHRLDGPAIIKKPRGEEWYHDGELHRDDGKPAVIQSNGNRFWYQQGKLHCETGPAITYSRSLQNEWYLHGEKQPSHFGEYRSIVPALMNGKSIFTVAVKKDDKLQTRNESVLFYSGS